MDKYEFNIKVEQIKKMVSRGDYETAMKIADTIDWHRVRNASLLSMIAEIYEKNKEYQEAKDILLLAFERAPIGKRLLYKLTETDEYFQIFLNPDGTEQEGTFWSSEEGSEPELYTEEEMSAVEQQIKKTFGEFDHVFHELVSPDIHVDICVVPPSEERDYYTLVTMGMGATG